MTDSPDEVIIIRYVLDAQDAITKAKSLQAETDKIRTEMQLMAAKSNVSFKELAAAMKTQALEQYKAAIVGIKTALQANLSTVTKNTDAITQYNQQAQAAMSATKSTYTQTTQAITAATTQLQQANKQFTQVGTSAKGAAGGFSVLGQAIGTALGFGTVQLIGKVIQGIRELIQYLSAAAQSGYEFAKGLYQLNVGVNALRRAGTDITFVDVLTQLQKLKKEFGIFATKDLVVGASAFLNLNRDMGFTKDQLFALQDAVATLAVVNGRAMDEVQRTVALALSSGYTEGLQRLGVSINRVTIAQEAATLGWDKGYTALTEQQRALATYNLILEKTKVYSEDLFEYQKTLPGQIDATSAEIIDINAKTGESLLGVKLLLEQTKRAWAEFVQWIADNSIVIEFLKEIENIISATANKTELPRQHIYEPFSMIGKAAADGTVQIKNIGDAFVEANKRAEEFYATVNGNVPTSLGGVNPAPPVSPKETGLSEEQALALEGLSDKILNLQEQLDIDRRDLNIDLQRDLAQIEADGADKLEELAANHAQKMLDIANKASEQIRDASEKYTLDVKQTWDDYYSNVASAAEKHTNKLLKVEEDYQEKLKRIKEGFLMDLEDALHARDARQVLKLIKQYNLDRTQATRERDQNLKEEERTYREQLHELDKQRSERLKKLAQEFKLRTEEIIRQRDRELALEVEAYNHKIAQQVSQNEQDKIDRETRYAEDLADLNTHLQDKLKAIAQSLIDEGTLTGQGMDAIYNIMKQYIGPGGLMEALYMYYVQMRNAAMSMGGFKTPPMSQLPTNKAKGGIEITKSKSYASGGMEIANKPTVAVFGDAGPELHLFLPLSGSLSNLSSTGKSELPTMKKGGEGKGKLQVEIMLGMGLEGKIIDRALNQVAEVTLRSVKR